MRAKKVLYYLINVCFILLAMLVVNYKEIINIEFSIQQIIILICILILIHLFKFIRIYFILLEERISIKKMIKIYLKTTFVSIVLPYKTGEIFKMYSYGKEIDNYSKGIIAVLIDKFFDAIILCSVLIPYEIIRIGNISKLSIILLFFSIIILLVYLGFETTYRYLNKFFVMKIKSKKGLLVLNFLEKLNHIFNYSKNMIKGRQIIVLFISIIIWSLEVLFIYTMMGFMNMKLELVIIVNYLSDAFWGINNVLFNNYVYLCTALFLVTIIYIYLKKFIIGGKKIWKK